MAAIRGTHTKPEKFVRSMLHGLGYRFRLHGRDLPGKPDIVLPKYRTVIFVNGCFWHSHSCRYGRVKPATRAEFWAAKRLGTVVRDEIKHEKLIEMGWRVLVVWECETKDSQGLAERLQSALGTEAGERSDKSKASLSGAVGRTGATAPSGATPRSS